MDRYLSLSYGCSLCSIEMFVGLRSYRGLNADRRWSYHPSKVLRKLTLPKSLTRLHQEYPFRCPQICFNLVQIGDWKDPSYAKLISYEDQGRHATSGLGWFFSFTLYYVNDHAIVIGSSWRYTWNLRGSKSTVVEASIQRLASCTAEVDIAQQDAVPRRSDTDPQVALEQKAVPKMSRTHNEDTSKILISLFSTFCQN
jgi:hypothetical protein